MFAERAGSEGAGDDRPGTRHQVAGAERVGRRDTALGGGDVGHYPGLRVEKAGG